MAIRKKRLFLQHTTSSEKWNSQNSRLSYACAARHFRPEDLIGD